MKTKKDLERRFVIGEMKNDEQVTEKRFHIHLISNIRRKK